MAHLVFDHEYMFYDLPEEERIKLIGRVFKVRLFRVNRKGHTKKCPRGVVYLDQLNPTMYFPVGLMPGEFNYGIQQGLVFVSGIHKLKEGNWFRVGACSPDDLDVDLDFGPNETHLRQDIIAFLKQHHKKDITYRGLMLQIQARFKAGTITS